ncbi:hypothetical protein ES288_D03G110200v1 [Gossypium darwinii]|uniref:Uncharacterized protein n=1 Tax=Gossypium darwinii TaxID=34276 RepID=A0A5D2D7T1_GOSDA|nr:hypothetical protein ES288_D03G110200v1 [Gossypium darwinii]
MPYNAPTCYWCDKSNIKLPFFYFVMQLELVHCPIPSLCKVALSVPVPVSLSPTSRCATLLFSISILHCQVKTLTDQTQLFLNVWIFSNRPLQLGFLLQFF